MMGLPSGVTPYPDACMSVAPVEVGPVIVYDRLGPGIRMPLHEYAGRNEKGRLKHQLHRFLTSMHGIPELQAHSSATVALMKAATNWEQFKEMLQRAFPKPETTLSMAFDDLEQVKGKPKKAA